MSDNPEMQVLIANAISNSVAGGTGALTDLAMGGSGLNGSVLGAMMQAYNQANDPNGSKVDETTQKIVQNLYDWVEAASYFPVIGDPASLALALMYAAKGDYNNASLNLAAAAIGIFVAGEGKLVVKGGVLTAEELLAGEKNNTYHTVAKETETNGGTNVDVTVKHEGKSIISPEIEDKILSGQRINGSNKVIGGHSSNINNVNSKYAVDEIKVNSDGTKTVKYTTQFDDGSLSKIKTSTLFPESWSDTSIINSIKQVGNTPTIGQRVSTGETLHRGVINGVEIDVIKNGDNIIAGYPVGGKPTVGFETIK